MSESEDAIFLTNATYLDPDQRQAALINKGFTLDSNYDNYFSAVKGNKVYHGHRGTSNSDDFWTDTHLAAGNLHDTARYKQSDLRSREAIRKYTNHEHIHVGHSLGGTLADHISRQYKGHKSVAYNLGSSPLQAQEKFDSNHQHNRSEDDVVSSFTGQKATNTVQTNSFQKSISTVAKKAVTGNFAASAAISIYDYLQAHKLYNF